MRTRRCEASLVCLAMLVAACGPIATERPSSPGPVATLAGSTAPPPSDVPSTPPATAYREWTRMDLPDPAPGVFGGGTPQALVAFRGTYVAAGTVVAECCAEGDPSKNRGVLWTSRDGRSWALRDHLATFDHASLAGLVTDGSRLVAVGTWTDARSGIPVRATWASSDGITWKRALGSVPNVVAAAPHGFVGAFAVLSGGEDPPSVRFATSADGLTWTGVSSTFEADLGALAVAADGSAIALGTVAGAPLSDGTETTETTDLVAWRSLDGSEWTGPSTIAHEAWSVAVAASGDGFLAVVVLADVPDENVGVGIQVWTLGPGVEHRNATIAHGDGDTVSSLFVVGDAEVVTGDTLVDGNANAAVWISSDGGSTYGRVVDQPAFSGHGNEISGLLAISGGLLAVGRRWDSPTWHPMPTAWIAAR